MDRPDLFRRIAHGLPVEPLLDAVAAHPELWGLNTTRQTFAGSPHHDTECIFLRWCKDHSLEAAFRDLDAEWLTDTSMPLGAAGGALFDVMRKVYSQICGPGNNELGRVLLTNLRAGGTIDYHADEGAYAEHYQRFHVSLQSDGGNMFFVDGQGFHAQPGELWWFNHRRPHMVVNKSQRGRLHLIVDAVVQ